MDKRSIQDLVVAMKSGDASAFEEIHRRYEKALYYMALKLTNNEADAEDMVQDAFIQMRTSINSLRNPDVFSLWLKRILYNRCKNMFRKNRNIYVDDMVLDSMKREEQTIEFLPEASAHHTATKDILLSCMNKISVLYSEPLYLKYYKSFTMEEIGAALNIPTGTVKSRLRSGKQMLRAEVCKFESENDVKLRFRGNTLGLGFFAALWMKRLSTAGPTTGMSVGAISTCAVVGGVVTVMAVSQLPMFQNNTASEHANMLSKEQNSSVSQKDEVAYYKLRNWAYAKEDIIKNGDTQPMLVYFQQLQEHKGVYWELLQQDDWAATFLSISE